MALLVVHPVDNVIRPYMIGGRAKLPTLFVFFALLGVVIRPKRSNPGSAHSRGGCGLVRLCP
jgi:hypothetical protein